MAEVQAADPPAIPTDNAGKRPDTQQDPGAQADEKSKTLPLDAESSEHAHAEDRRDNESARVKEARRYNNRDRHRHNGDNDERPHKKKAFTRNNKFDPSTLPESSDPALIRKQVISIKYIARIAC